MPSNGFKEPTSTGQFLFHHFTAETNRFFSAMSVLSCKLGSFIDFTLF